MWISPARSDIAYIGLDEDPDSRTRRRAKASSVMQTPTTGRKARDASWHAMARAPPAGPGDPMTRILRACLSHCPEAQASLSKAFKFRVVTAARASHGTARVTGTVGLSPASPFQARRRR